jgi:vacuolar-type H+-ATPase subunit E/Vma4
MNLLLAKEKIKHQIDLIEDKKVLKAIEQILSQFDHSDATSQLLNEPLTDEEMGIPGGRLPTKAQLEEWLDRDDGPGMTGEEALVYIRKKSEDLKNNK